MSTTIVWFRRDLRVHDNPALAQACAESDRVVALYVLDPRLLHGRFASRRAHAVPARLHRRAGRRAALARRPLVLRIGSPETEVASVAAETGATRVLAAGDVSPYARGRDRRVARALGDGTHLELTPGVFIAELGGLRTGAGSLTGSTRRSAAPGRSSRGDRLRLRPRRSPAWTGCARSNSRRLPISGLPGRRRSRTVPPPARPRRSRRQMPGCATASRATRTPATCSPSRPRA